MKLKNVGTGMFVVFENYNTVYMVCPPSESRFSFTEGVVVNRVGSQRVFNIDAIVHVFYTYESALAFIDIRANGVPQYWNVTIYHDQEYITPEQQWDDFLKQHLKLLGE